MPQDMQRALLVDGLPQTAQQRVTRSGPVVLRQSLPCRSLRRLNPCQDVCGKQSQLAVILGGILIGVLPPLSGQIFADFDFEADFIVQAHVLLSGDWRFKASSVLPSLSFHSNHPLALRPIRAIAAMLGAENK